MQDIKASFAQLLAARDADADAETAWPAFVDAMRQRRQRPLPAHYALLIELAENMAERRGGTARVRILDHGCGSGRTVLLLRALGFTQAMGVDLAHAPHPDRWNAWLKDVSGSPAPFHRYDGLRLPFTDDSFDVVFSQQVIEHLPPKTFDAYFAEEDRVLVPDGLCYHQAPHRLTPFDSHSNTWCVHYLPRPLHAPIYRALGRKHEHLSRYLHLRMPHTIRHSLQSHIGHCADLTANRVADLSASDGYDGPLALRKLSAALCKTPGLGALAKPVVTAFIMRELVASRGPSVEMIGHSGYRAPCF